MRISDWSSDVCSSDLYGPDVYANTTIPGDPRTVNTAYTPSYFTSELTIQGQIEHNFGPVSLQVSGQYQKIKLDASQDYNSNVGNRALYGTGLANLQAAASGAFGPGLQAYRSDEHTSELQSLMRNSYAVFCLTQNK